MILRAYSPELTFILTWYFYDLELYPVYNFFSLKMDSEKITRISRLKAKCAAANLRHDVRVVTTRGTSIRKRARSADSETDRISVVASDQEQEEESEGREQETIDNNILNSSFAASSSSAELDRTLEGELIELIISHAEVYSL